VRMNKKIAREKNALCRNKIAKLNRQSGIFLVPRLTPNKKRYCMTSFESFSPP